jgi:acyl-[acyl-carrier-protein]-phospholipid O-acyltransferase/long-chain-fatty-acid--[acyl-carrier-protein] ligase
MKKDDLRSFRALVGAQFFGAFNDNLFKQLILFLAAGMLFSNEDKQGLAVVTFSLPFVLFSGMAGDLSEKFKKDTIIFQMKVAEIAIMVLGTVALQLKNWHFMLVVLFTMGLQSAFFGPSKYGVIPELVTTRQLLRANGVIAMTTFLAVLLGQALAGPLIDLFGNRLWISGTVCIGLAVVGTLLARRMAPLSPKKPGLEIGPSPFGRLLDTIRDLKQHDGLFRIVLLHSLFWFNGVVIQQAILGLGESDYLNVVEGEKRLLSYLLVTLALSIITGSVIGPRLSKYMTAGRMMTVGATAAVAGQFALLLIGSVVTRGNGGIVLAHVLLAWIGFAGALFVVPIQSYIQHAPQDGAKGQTFAVNNFMNFLFMLFGGVYYLIARLPKFDVGPTVAQAGAGVILMTYLWIIRDRVKRVTIE